MSTTRDWLPGTRTGQLTMAQNWRQTLAAKAAAWKIPPEQTARLEEHAAKAGAALAAAQNEATRTPVATAQCNEDFARLAAEMRDLKKRYLYVPPLQNADLVSLGLKPHDTTPTPGGTPAAQATVETYLVGRHELGVKIVYVTGNPHDAANKGYRVYYAAPERGGQAPASPEDLTASFFTKRKKDVIEFGFDDSGKTAYFAVQIENEGKKGPWGPLVSALIP